MLKLLNLLILFTSAPLFACPELLQKDKELCRLSDRYMAVAEELSEDFQVDIEHLAQYRALRFIDRSSWERSLSQGQFLAWHIYSPKPDTWLQWERGAQFLQSELSDLSALTLQDVKDLHKASITHELMTPWRIIKGGAPGRIRSAWWQLAPGWKFECHHGITAEQVNRIEDYDLLSSDGKPLLRFIDKIKFESRRRRLGGKLRRKLQYKILEDRRCEGAPSAYEGHYFHLASHKVPQELALWLKMWNLAFDSSAEGVEEPLKTLARLQRHFVAIHPFGDGNGRVSRFLQDWATEKMGLAFLPSGDLQNDILEDPELYAKRVRLSAFEMVKHLEACLETYRERSSGLRRAVPLACRSLYKVQAFDSEEIAEEKGSFQGLMD